MGFEIAKRQAQPVILSLAGRSGSGKTYSALLLAQGLVGEVGKIAVIDTERGRASMYADDPRIGQFYSDELHPPFSPSRFIEKLKQAQEFGADCIIIDSVSHEWSGIGGVLEQVDALIQSKGQSYRMPAWGRLKPQHNQFVNHLTMMPCHVICCVRAKKKLVEQVDPKTNKKEWVELPDLVAEQQENFVYEMTAAALIDDEHSAKWTKVPEPLKNVLVAGVVNKEQGAAIREWVAGGANYDKDVATHLAKLRHLANQGVQSMRDYWSKEINNAPKAVRDGLVPHLPDIQKMAEEADAINASRSDGATEQELPDDPFADKFTPQNGNGKVQPETKAQ